MNNSKYKDSTENFQPLQKKEEKVKKEDIFHYTLECPYCELKTEITKWQQPFYDAIYNKYKYRLTCAHCGKKIDVDNLGVNMFNYKEIGITLKNHNTIIKEDKYGYFIAVKVFCEEDYQLLKLYYAEAKSSCWSRTPVSEIAGEYEGPDWYFFEGSSGDRYGPSSYRLESLSFKKRKFEEFCAQYD